MRTTLQTLDAEGLLGFRNLEAEAIGAVTARFYATHGSAYGRAGRDGQLADDLLGLVHQGCAGRSGSSHGRGSVGCIKLVDHSIYRQARRFH